MYVRCERTFLFRSSVFLYLHKRWYWLRIVLCLFHNHLCQSLFRYPAGIAVRTHPFTQAVFAEDKRHSVMDRAYGFDRFSGNHGKHRYLNTSMLLKAVQSCKVCDLSPFRLYRILFFFDVPLFICVMIADLGGRYAPFVIPRCRNYAPPPEPRVFPYGLLVRSLDTAVDKRF